MLWDYLINNLYYWWNNSFLIFRHGQGKYILNDPKHSVRNGIWDDGKRVKWINDKGDEEKSEEENDNWKINKNMKTFLTN